MSDKYREALKHLLYSLNYSKGWPHIQVCIGLDDEGHTIWVSGGVDDETCEAIRNAEKCLEENGRQLPRLEKGEACLKNKTGLG